MAPPTQTIAKNKGAGDLQFFFLLGGTTLDAAQDGNNVTETLFNLNGTFHQINNLIVEAFGKRFYWQGDAIRERDQGGDGVWGIVYNTDQTPSNGGLIFSGLHLMHPAGTPTLAALYFSTSGSMRLVSSTDGINWTEIQIGTATVNNSASNSSRSVVFGDTLVWMMNGNGSDSLPIIWLYDLNLASLTTYSPNQIAASAGYGGSSGNQACTADLLVHQGQLIYAGCAAFSTAFILRLEGSTWHGIHDFGGGVWSNPGRCAILSDGDNICMFYPNAAGQKPRAATITDPLGSPIVTANNTTVTTNFPNVGTTNQVGFQKFLDLTDPTSPQWYFWLNLGDVDTGTYDCWQFNGNSAAATSIGAGVSAASYTIVSIGDGANERIAAIPQGRVQFSKQSEASIDARRRFFRVYGTGSDINLRQYHNTDQEGPDVLSTLKNGSISMNDAVDVTGLVGNANETTIEGLTPSAGDAYVLTELNGDRTLNPGGLVDLIPGDIVQYNGSAWTLAVQVVDVEERLEGYWKFDGDGTDRTGNGRDFTLTGAVPFASGQFGQAADLPGTNGNYWDRGTDDDIFDFSEGNAYYTISVWVNADTLSQASIVAKGGGAAIGWSLHINASGDLTFQGYRASSVQVTALGAISAAAGWQHIVVVGDGALGAELYVDGVSAGTDTGTVTWNISSFALRVGNNVDNDEPFDGQVDELAIWSRALSSAEVTSLYNSGSGRELGYPSFGTHATLNSTTALIAPYTDGVDDGKTVSFAGTSMTGTVLTAPSSNTTQITGITPDEGATEWTYEHDVLTDGMSPGQKHSAILDTL